MIIPHAMSDMYISDYNYVRNELLAHALQTDFLAT